MLDESILAGGGGNLHLGTLWRWYVVLVTFSAREKCVRWLYSTSCILLPANIRVTFSATRDRSLWTRQLRARGRRRPQLTRRLQEASRSQAPTGPQRTWCLLRWVSWLRPLRSLSTWSEVRLEITGSSRTPPLHLPRKAGGTGEYIRGRSRTIQVGGPQVIAVTGTDTGYAGRPWVSHETSTVYYSSKL